MSGNVSGRVCANNDALQTAERTGTNRKRFLKIEAPNSGQPKQKSRPQWLDPNTKPGVDLLENNQKFTRGVARNGVAKRNPYETKSRCETKPHKVSPAAVWHSYLEMPDLISLRLLAWSYRRMTGALTFSWRLETEAGIEKALILTRDANDDAVYAGRLVDHDRGSHRHLLWSLIAASWPPLSRRCDRGGPRPIGRAEHILAGVRQDTGAPPASWKFTLRPQPREYTVHVGRDCSENLTGAARETGRLALFFGGGVESNDRSSPVAERTSLFAFHGRRLLDEQRL